MLETISSLQNPRVKLIQKLRDKKSRTRERLFVVDYERDLERALDSGYAAEYALYCDELGEIPDSTKSKLTCPTFAVTRRVMDKVSYRQNPSPLVCVIRQKPSLSLVQFNIAQSQHILVLVGLTKPGNIGALLRTADAAGFTAILLVDTDLDIYNPNIIRSSTGACFLDNIYITTTNQTVEFLRDSDYTIISTHLDGNMSLFDINFRQKTAIVLGTEDTGLPDNWVKHCDHLAKIPMSGQITDSLNVSASGAIIMYEAYRQTITHNS